MNIFYKTLFLFAWIIAVFGCTHQNASSGRVAVTGTFTDSILGKQNNTYTVITFSVPNVILGRITDYQTTVNPNGSFSMVIPVVSPIYATVNVGSEIYEGQILLSPGKTTRLDFLLDKSAKLNLHVIEGTELKSKDLENIWDVSNKVRKVVEAGLNSPKFTGPSTPQAYSDSMLIRMDKDLAIVYEDSALSEGHKELLSNLLKQFYLNGIFDYEDSDKSYYAFLQRFDLNHPPQLNDIYYSANLRAILTQPELNIPPIGDMPVTDWLKKVKETLSNLTGIDSGLFYDMFAAEAYINQFRNELNPLSEKQKENIQTYFTNSSFADILFSENKKTILRLLQIEQNKQSNVVVNEIPSVAKEELMNAIISKYKGKVVLVDFWATWCAPCMEAMEEMKPLEGEMKDKNIIFVYITYTSSPKRLWEKKIQEIGGEHYYLTEEEYKSIVSSNQYGFNGIPTYMLFDSNGKLKYKITAYPGNEKMQAMIEELL